MPEAPLGDGVQLEDGGPFGQSTITAPGVFGQ